MKEMDEFQQFAEELEDEEFMDDLEEYDEDMRLMYCIRQGRMWDR